MKIRIVVPYVPRYRRGHRWDFVAPVTALHLAALAGQDEVAKLLVAAGADVNARKGDRTCPLHDAAQSGSKTIAALLLAKGADVNASG